MFCSTIIPTIGRATLARTVESVLAQSIDAGESEIIVVNDSGQPLPVAAWQQAPTVRIIETLRHERSVARNTGAALAQGCYLHFLDDDDWLLPGALKSFELLAQQAKSAGWLYGAAQLVDRSERPLIQLQHNLAGNAFVQVMAGEWIPLQASLIKASAFFTVGGFNPLLAGPEDIDLLRRIALHEDLAGMPTAVACVGMGQTNSTTDHARHAERSRWAREQILHAPGVFARLQRSVVGSSWHGRLVRIYLTSLLWNLQRGNFATAVSRAMYAVAGLGNAGRHAFSGHFWQALRRGYASETFQRGWDTRQETTDTRRTLTPHASSVLTK